MLQFERLHVLCKYLLFKRQVGNMSFIKAACTDYGFICDESYYVFKERGFWVVILCKISLESCLLDVIFKNLTEQWFYGTVMLNLLKILIDVAFGQNCEHTQFLFVS